MAADPNVMKWATAISTHAETGRARFDYAITDIPELPIEIHATHDKNWDMYRKFRAEVKETVN